MRREAADLSADTNPLCDDLKRDDQNRPWKLVVPLQVHLIPWAKVGTVHQLLGDRNLSVWGDLPRPMWRVHVLQTTNICSIQGDRTDLSSRQAGGGRRSRALTVMDSGGWRVVRHESAGCAEQDPFEFALP